MRKIFKSFMLVAAAAMAYTSCQKEETAAPETVSATLTMHAGVEETKTYLDENNAVLWGKGEAVTLYVGAGETAKFFDSASTDAYDGKASASFTFAIEDVDQADSYALGGIYPASAAMDDNKNAAQYKVILPATQNQVDGNYDPSAYIMVLKPEVVTELPAEYTASFRRAVALNKITLTGVKENISSVEITVEPSQEGLYLAGRRYVDLTTAEFGKIYYDQTNTVTVNAPYTGSSIDVWFTSWGMDLKSGDKLTIKMTSATKTYTRTIIANENGIKFVEGDLNTLKINMASAEEETTGLLENGDYLIAGVFSNNVYVATAYVSGNNLKSVQVTVSDNKIPEVEGLSNCKMTITKITEGDYAGMYTITDVNGKYLYAASNSGNQLKSREEPDVNSYWTIKPEDDGTYSIVASKSTNRNVMQMNPNNNNPLFSCYATLDLDNYQRVILYPYSMIVPDTTPKINVSSDLEQTVGADGGDVKIEYTLKNLDGMTLTVEENSDFVSASVAAGVVTVTVDANEATESRSATLTLKCGEAAPVSVTVNQAGKQAAGEPTEVTDVLTPSVIGVSGSSYTAWSNKKLESLAVYAGNSSAGTGIQLKSSGSTSGIITTSSGGTVSKIIVKWHSSTTSGRTLDIYGKSTAYTAPSDLYGSNDKGTKIGSIVKGTSTELVVDGEYQFIGLRSNNGAMYFEEIQIVWETGNTGGETPEPGLQERNLAFSSTTATATVGDDFAEPTLNGATDGVTYSSSNTSVATVNETTGEVTLVAAGETTITATAAADATYKAGTASYTLTVSAAQGGAKMWKLVTDASSLQAGDKLAIVSTAKGKVASATISSGYMNETAVTISNNSFTALPSGAAELTLGGSSGAWTLTNASGNELGATAVKKVAWDSGTTTWTITIASNGDATIQNGTSSYGRFLYNVNSPRFTTYTSNASSSMLLPQIYRYE